MAYIFIRLSDKAKAEFLTAIEIMNYNNGTRYNQQDMGEALITKWAKKFLRNQKSLVDDNRESVDAGFITELKDLSPESKKIIKQALNK